jgi:pimeloyl-ACP methyl ester carboxylesterase
MALHSTQIGSGEPLLLVHGLGSSSRAFNLIAPELAKRFTVVAIDLPGHGHSPHESQQAMDPVALAQRLFDEMSLLGFDSFHLAGNSLGGWIALEMAALHPDRVKSLIALAPAGLWLTPYPSRVPGAAVSRAMAVSLKSVAPSLLKYDWAKKIGFGLVSPKWRELPLDVLINATLDMGTSEGYFPAWDAFLGARFEGEISANVPTTIIFGDIDNTLPARTSQERSLVPVHAKWVVLSNCGHAPMWDQPEAVVAEIFSTAGILT